MKSRCILFLFFFLLSTGLRAQQKVTTHRYAAYKTTKSKKKVKKPVRSVYYPDFYTFYDSSRNGYVYWDKDQWKVSPDRPSFMKDIDLGRTRIEILHDETKNGFPESHYEQYLQLYPPQPVSPTVPVPILTIRRKHKH